MKKLQKIKLTQLSNADLNERELCRILGGGTPGCCQCSCAGTSSTASNSTANNAKGQYSDTPPQCSGCGCTPTLTSQCSCPPPQASLCTTSCAVPHDALCN